MARGTDEEVLYGQYPTDKWNIYIDVHINSLYRFPVGLPVVPVVRCWKEPLNLEVTLEILTEIIEGLHIAVRPVYLLVPMGEVDVRRNEYTTTVKEIRYFRKFPGLKVSDIFKNSLGDDYVETLAVKPDWRLKKVSLDQIRPRVMYGYVNAIVLDIWAQERHQGRGPAANIKEQAFFALREPIYNSCGFFEAIMRSAVLQVLRAPEILLVQGVADAASRNHVFAVCRILHIRSSGGPGPIGGPRRFGFREELGGQRSKLVVDKPHLRRAALRQRLPQLP